MVKDNEKQQNKTCSNSTTTPINEQNSKSSSNNHHLTTTTTTTTTTTKTKVMNDSLKTTVSSSLASSLSDEDVPFIPVTVDENDIIGGAKEILTAIRPDWNLINVKYKLFTDGITNKLIGCFHHCNKSEKLNDDDDNDDQESCDTKNVVLIRIYGNKTDLLIDRKAETRNIKLLHKYGFAPSLYAIFNNGLCYEFIEGCTLTPDTVMLPKVWKLVAKRMAEMHKVTDNSITSTSRPREPMLKHKSEQFLNLIPQQFNDPNKHEKVKDMFLPVQKLRDEFKFLYEHLEKLNSPIVFSHNDLLLGNVIYTESENRVTFIDYEYADYNFQAFDIGNHFAEFAGIDSVDHSRYPSKEYQYEWLKVYLENYLDTNEVKQKDIERLYVQVNQFALASHFFWAIWALIQTEHSTIDFDFASFAKIRYQEYLSKRDKFLSLKYNE